MTPPPYHSRVLAREGDTLRFALEIPADSPYLQGHFPGQPILPGVAQVQICSELLGRSLGRQLRLQEVLNVRFRKPITPGLALEVELRPRGFELDFLLRSAEGNMAEGSLLLHESVELDSLPADTEGVSHA